jgi:hypothetical protein
MEVLVVEGVWDVEVDDASGVGVAFCVDEVSGAGDADTGGEDDETCAGFVVGVEVAAFAEVEGGGVPVTIVVPLCGTGSALCASQVLSTCCKFPRSENRDLRSSCFFPEKTESPTYASTTNQANHVTVVVSVIPLSILRLQSCWNANLYARRIKHVSLSTRCMRINGKDWRSSKIEAGEWTTG